MSKTCSKCGADKPTNAFHARARSKDGKAPWCKECYREYNGRRYRADPSAATARHRLRTYGLSAEDFAFRVRMQGGCCEACDEPPAAHGNGDGWAVDHCHETGRIRALLCHNCNRSLGMLQEDPARIRKLADYAVTFCAG